MCTQCVRQWRWWRWSADLLSLGGRRSWQVDTREWERVTTLARRGLVGMSEGGLSDQSDAGEGWFSAGSVIQQVTWSVVACNEGGGWLEEWPDRLIYLLIPIWQSKAWHQVFIKSKVLTFHYSLVYNILTTTIQTAAVIFLKGSGTFVSNSSDEKYHTWKSIQIGRAFLSISVEREARSNLFFQNVHVGWWSLSSCMRDLGVKLQLQFVCQIDILYCKHLEMW